MEPSISARCMFPVGDDAWEPEELSRGTLAGLGADVRTRRRRRKEFVRRDSPVTGAHRGSSGRNRNSKGDPSTTWCLVVCRRNREDQKGFYVSLSHSYLPLPLSHHDHTHNLRIISQSAERVLCIVHDTWIFYTDKRLSRDFVNLCDIHFHRRA